MRRVAMLGLEAGYVAYAAAGIDLLTAVVVGYHVGWALWLILRGAGVDAARLRVAEGVLAGLGFSVAGSLLKTLVLQDWPTIRTFAFVFAFRTLLKRVFLREEKLAAGRAAQA